MDHPIWINVKDQLPDPKVRVIRYDSEVNRSQMNMSVTIVEGIHLRYAEETTWWCHIPELPVPLKVY